MYSIMKKKLINGESSIPQHIIELSNYTLELKNKIEQANLLDGNSGHKFVFKTGSFNLVLPEYQPAEVIVPPRICAIPNTPDWFRGMINLRGNLLPVFDLDGLITGAHSETRNWLIVFGNDESMASLCIDTLPTSMELNNKLDLADDEIPEILYKHLNNIYLEDNVIWLEPDYESLLSEFSMHF